MKRAAIYARLSVTTEESVSIARQVEAAERYAAARGWRVVLTATDDGVSATSRRPEDRPGWRAILDSPERFEVVVVWKVDRLARRVLDFLTADAALQERGAALVAVEDPIDLTTAQGRAFATMLAVFGEMEAAAISARVKGARAHLAREGRAVGARPWPFESVPNPDGPGLVWRPLPDRAAAVRDAAARLTAGTASLRQIAREWTERWTPPLGGASWDPSSVRRLLRSPVLTGATPQGDDVVRNPDGTVRRDPARAILSPSEHRALLARLDARSTGPLPPADLPLLHGLAVCGSCGSGLSSRRPRDPSRPALYACRSRECPARVTIEARRLEPLVVDRFLLEAPRKPVEAWIDSQEPTHLADLHEALEAVQEALVAASEPAAEAALLDRRRTLRESIAEAEAATRSERREIPGVDLLDVWHAATTTAERREALSGLFERVEVRRTAARKGSEASQRVRLVTK